MVALVEIHCLSPKVARLMVLVAVKTSSAVERQRGAGGSRTLHARRRDALQRRGWRMR
jgi:hypothetical protein